jgi:hypothetical protein
MQPNHSTVMWRLRHPDGNEAYAVISPKGSQVAALCFVVGKLQEARTCRTLHGAVRWLERKLVKLQIAGWALR